MISKSKKVIIINDYIPTHSTNLFSEIFAKQIVRFDVSILFHTSGLAYCYDDSVELCKILLIEYVNFC